MDQPSFADLEYQGKKRKTRRELFLERMDGLIPWQRLEDRIHPFYPKAGRGRHPYPLAAMLRIHCVQLFYNLSDPGMEDLLYESDPVRRFAGLKLTGYLPDETTILNFRHLLERHNLGQGLLEEINAHLESPGASAAGGNHRGRHHHRGAVFHQEPCWGTGPGDASDPEGEPVALRDEGAHRCGLGDRHSPQHEHYCGQRARCYRDPQSAARGRDGGVGRRRVSGG